MHAHCFSRFIALTEYSQQAAPKSVSPAESYSNNGPEELREPGESSLHQSAPLHGGHDDTPTRPTPPASTAPPPPLSLDDVTRHCLQESSL